MISNCGIKGALIANDGLRGYYLEDMPPDGRKYNLLDHAAAFGGIVDRNGSFYVDKNNRDFWISSYLKSKTPEVVEAGTTIKIAFDDVAHAVSYSRSGAANHNKAALFYPLPPEWQRLSLVFQATQTTTADYSGHAPLRLLVRSTFSRGTYYDQDAFSGGEIWLSKSTAVISANGGSKNDKYPPASHSMQFYQGDCFIVSYSKDDQIFSVQWAGKDLIRVAMPIPDALFMGYSLYGGTVKNTLI